MEKERIQILKKINLKDIIFQVLYWIFAITIFLYFRNDVFSKVNNIIQISMVILAIGIDILLIIANKCKLEIYKQFIILATVLGLGYFIVTPFGSGTDEVSHFLRVFKISQKYTNIKLQEDSMFPLAFSKLIDYKNNAPEAIKKYDNYINEFEAFSMNSESKYDLIDEYWNIKLYAPIQYIPQAFGVTIGRVISDNIIIIGMIGRLTGYIFWVTICALAIKIIPNKKVFFMMLCLLPINIFSAVCISGDTVTNAICMLFIAIIYKKVYLKDKISKKENILLIFLACLIALCKIVYLPLVTLVLLLKEENFENKKSWKKFIVLTILISTIISFAWLIVGSTKLVDSNSSSKEQMEFILKNPFEYCGIIIRTITQKGDWFIFQLCTGNELMCHAKTTVYPIISYIISIALIMSLFINEEEKQLELNNLRKIWTGLIILGTGILIVTAIYIQWTSLFEIGKDVIEGIQGRYFIPVVSILIFIINKTKIETNKKYLFTTIILMQLPILYQIMNVFI